MLYHYSSKPKESPWKRELKRKSAPRPRGMSKVLTNNIDESFYGRSKENRYFDIHTTRAALKVSRAVVSIVTRIGDELLFKTSGTIIECAKHLEGNHLSTILTSATLLGSQATNDIQVDVRMVDGSVYVGRIFAYDLHYNVAILHIQSEKTLPTATLCVIDDCLKIDPMEIFHSPKNKIQLEPHSNLFKISPGDKLVALGRYNKGSILMVA